MLRTRSSRASRGELMSVVQQSHVEPGVGCSVDVGSGLAGSDGSAEAENMGTDVDGGAASTPVLPEASLKIATSIGTKVRYQLTRVMLSQSTYRSEEVTRRLSTTLAPTKYSIENHHENTVVPTVVFPSPTRRRADTKGDLLGTRRVSRKGQGWRTEYQDESLCAIRYEEKDHGERPLTLRSAIRKSTSRDEKVEFNKTRAVP